jgi:hypothetical protein
MVMAATGPRRTACHGSCHCGLTQYIIILSLPHPFSSTNFPKPTDQEIYRCNCTTCHKMGFFHVNPANSRDDFIVIEPKNPEREMSSYTPEGGRHKWFFCPKCGVRCFTVEGEGEVVSTEASELGDTGVGDGDEGKREGWRVKWDGKGDSPYVSVNGITIDFEGFDMRLLTEEKRVQYLDDRSEPAERKQEARWERPHYGGCY